MSLVLQGFFEEKREQKEKNDYSMALSLIPEEIKKMAYIRYRTDGRFEAVISYQGKKNSVYAKNITELQKKIKEKNNNLKQLPYIQQNKVKFKSGYTLNKYYIYWFKNFKEPFIKERSAKNIEIYFQIHILPKLGEYYLEELTTQKIQEFLNQLKKTRNKELITTYLKAILTKAYNEDLIDKNPFVNVIKEKKLSKVKDGFTLEEQKIIISEMENNETKKIILIYLLTGIRRNEINQILEINDSKNYIKVKCEKSDDNRTRNISLTTYTINLIKECCSKYINTEKVYYNFKKFLNSKNIKKNLHTTRHTYTTNNFYLGNDMKYVSTWLGHKDISITLNIYTNLHESLEDREQLKNLYNNAYYIAPKF